MTGSRPTPLPRHGAKTSQSTANFVQARVKCYGFAATYQKLRDARDFESQASLCEGLKRTIEWVQNPDNLRGYKGFLYDV